MSSFFSSWQVSSKGLTISTWRSQGAWSCPGSVESLFLSSSLICQVIMSSTSSSYSSSGETSPEDLHRGGGTIRVYLPNKQRTVVRYLHYGWKIIVWMIKIQSHGSKSSKLCRMSSNCASHHFLKLLIANESKISLLHKVQFPFWLFLQKWRTLSFEP